MMTTHQEDEIADTEPVQERGLDPIRMALATRSAR